MMAGPRCCGQWSKLLIGTGLITTACDRSPRRPSIAAAHRLQHLAVVGGPGTTSRPLRSLWRGRPVTSTDRDAVLIVR